MPQWSEHLPPTSVAWVQFNSSEPYWVEFVVVSVLLVSSLHKKQHFQIPIQHTTGVVGRKGYIQRDLGES